MLGNIGLKLSALSIMGGLMIYRHPEFFQDLKTWASTLDSSRAMSMLLVVFGCFSAYRKISARQRKLMTAGGVGMRLDVDECDEGWVVLEVVDGGSAQAGGLKVSDIITHVDGVEVSELEGISVIRGKVGSFVELRGTSNGKAFEMKLERRPVIPRAGMAIKPAPLTDEETSNEIKKDSDKKQD